jgi:hypothetical protein
MSLSSNLHLAAAIGFVLASFSTSACIANQSGAARMQEAAQELNLNTRFGRLELAMEHVSAKDRDAFIARHKKWGSRVRIADSELAGMHLTSKEEAEVTVKVAWYKPDEQELRLTTIRQRYRDYKGDWKLEDEQRIDGDIGLLGEPIQAVESPAPVRQAQFPTVRLSE